MSKLKVSIIVPVYNTEKYLLRCIKSILNQSYRNIELILVDDGSTDNSGTICDEILSQDKRVKVIHTKNNGVSSARNIGIDYSTGSYIGFVDSDDYIDINMYRDMVSISEKFNLSVVCCNYLRGNIDNYKFKEYIDWNFKMISSEEIFKISYKKESLQYLIVCNKLYKKEILNNIKFDEDIKMGEDHIFCNKVYSRVTQIGFINNPYYYYYIGNEYSVCSNVDIEKRMDQIKSYIKEYKYFSVENPKILNLVIMRILYTIKFRLDKAIERNDSRNIEECKILLSQWYKILLENKDINIFEKLIITLNIKSRLYQNMKLLMYKSKQKIKKFI